MTQRVTGQRFRQRKLSTKQNIPVLREHEVERLDDDEASRHIPKVETGVEKGEEIVSPATSRIGLSLLMYICRMSMHLPAHCALHYKKPQRLTFIALRCTLLTILLGAPLAGRYLCSAGSSPRCHWR
jgi:hypothetical protein